MLDRLAHVAIAVPSIDEAATRLRDRYGLEIAERTINHAQGVRMAYVDAGNLRIELLEPLDPGSALARFLERNPGGGFHHLSFNVPDMDEARAGLAERGVQPIESPEARNAHGERIAFLHPRDFLGVLVELEESPPPDKAAE
jgi:methylmalonyl-CoA/ethylmalonyl-CoA epimerase